MEKAQENDENKDENAAGTSNFSEYCNESLLQMLDVPFDAAINGCSFLRTDNPQYCGFDNNAGSTWIYPVNHPIRSYQFNITRVALFKNTLVVLPTGLGKTFIAAVVMYNIFRWYPMGKVIFMAPTKPLVAQQVEACRKIMGIPLEDTAEMTGKVNKSNRRELWQSKRVFFATPQVILSDINDVEQGFPFPLIKLLVVDEAHRAKGRYAYTEVAQTMTARNPYFRILALSATPGRKIEDVAEVIKNLFISHIEIRSETSIDVSSYTHKKCLKVIPISLGDELSAIRADYIAIMDPYLRYLIENNAIAGNSNNMSRGRLIMEQKRFRQHSLQQRPPNYAELSNNFSICISLYHGLELLEQHGTRVFLNFFEDNKSNEPNRDKFFVALNPEIKAFVNKLRNHVGPNPFSVCDLSMTNGQIAQIPDDLDFGHPKYYAARNLLLEHFEKNSQSRAIVFCEYRESVLLLHKLFLQNRPQIKPRIFVGQGGTGSIRAVTQKEQMEVMNDFRSGNCNTLISTSVGEEGIDVGEVELIICFDISTKNPTRFTQRIGRTGRRKQGSVVVLATEGREHSVVKEVLATKDKTNQKILKNRDVLRTLYTNSPRLVPPEFNPQCVETVMQIKEPEPASKKRKKAADKDSPPPREKKPRKTKVSKETKSSLTQDVRKFFRKEELSEEDQKDFSSPLEHLPINSLLLDKNELRNDDENFSVVKELFDLKSPNKESVGSHEISSLFNLINKRALYLSDPTKIIPSVTVEDALKCKNLTNEDKKFILERNFDYVREKCEAMEALQAVEDYDDVLGEDECELKKIYSELEKVLGGKYGCQFFLEQGRTGKLRTSFTEELDEQRKENYRQLEEKFGGYFKQFEKRNFDDDVESFINNQMKLISVDDVEMVSDLSSAVCEMNFSTKGLKYDDHINEYAPNIVVEPADENFDFDMDLGNCDSKYMSQWSQNKITDQSTPIRKEKHILTKARDIQDNKTTDKMNISAEEHNDIIEIFQMDDDFSNIEHFTTWEKINENKEIEKPKNQNLAVNSDLNIRDDCKEKSMINNFCHMNISKQSNPDMVAGAINITTKNASKFDNNMSSDIFENCEFSDNFFKKLNHKENVIENIDNIFDDDFDEIIVNHVATNSPQKEKQDGEESFINADELLNLLEVKEKEKLKTKNPQNENINPNDFGDAFESDDDIVWASQPISNSNKENNPDFSKNNNKVYVSAHKSPLKKESSSIEEARNIPKHNSKDTTSPSVLRKKVNLTQLGFLLNKNESAPNTGVVFKPHLNQSREKLIQSNSPTSRLNNSTKTSHQLMGDSVEDSQICRGFLKKRKLIQSSDSEENDDLTSESKVAAKYSSKPQIHRKTKKRRYNFVIEEAEVSGDDSEDEILTCDYGLSQFVDDSVLVNEDPVDQSHTDLQAKFLHSIIRNPNNMPGRFKIPNHNGVVNFSKIYSQPVEKEDSSYADEDDSFVVTDDENVEDGEVNETCPLERAEAILRAQRRAKKNGLRNEKSTENNNQGRWKNIIEITDSSEDETR